MLDILAQQAPLTSEYYLYKAMIAYEGQNDPAAALKFLARVPEGDPHYAQALQFRVQLLNVQGRRDEALSAAREGLRLFPKQSRFYVLVAGLLAESKDLAGAKEVMDRGVASCPRTPICSTAWVCSSARWRRGRGPGGHWSRSSARTRTTPTP